MIKLFCLFSYRVEISDTDSDGLYVDEHRLLLIATDGHFVMPEMVDFIIIHSGERYDFIPQIRDPSSARLHHSKTLEVPMRCDQISKPFFIMVMKVAYQTLGVHYR